MSNLHNTGQINWSTASYNISPHDSYNFGLSGQHIAQLKSLLASAGFQLREGSDKGLTLEHIKATIAYLKERNLFQPDLKTAVEKLFPPPAAEPVQQANAPDESPQAEQAPGVPPESSQAKQPFDALMNEVFVRELQLVLRSFMSPNPPFNVMADGRLGPQTERAFQMVMRSYNMKADLTWSSIENLRTISERIVRVYCKDEEIISSVRHNPFCIIHKDAKEYEITSKAILQRMSDKKELVSFTDLRTRHDSALQGFNAFSAWFMLLTLQGSHEKGRDVEIDTDSNVVSTLSPSDFIVPPKYVVEFDGVKPINAKSNARSDNDVIPVMFSKTMRIEISPGFNSTLAGERSNFDFAKFFSENPTENSEEVDPLLHADFLKFFVVTKDFGKNVMELLQDNPPGVDVTVDFYKLITASKESIVFTTLVGLVVDREKGASYNAEDNE